MRHLDPDSCRAGDLLIDYLKRLRILVPEGCVAVSGLAVTFTLILKLRHMLRLAWKYMKTGGDRRVQNTKAHPSRGNNLSRDVIARCKPSIPNKSSSLFTKLIYSITIKTDIIHVVKVLTVRAGSYEMNTHLVNKHSVRPVVDKIHLIQLAGSV